MHESDPGTFLDSLTEADLADEAAMGAAIDELIGRHEPESLADAIAARLDPLAGRGGELLIALVEGLAREDLWEVLADAIVDQPGIAPDLAYLALEVLEGTGRIEARPELIELRSEFDDELEEGLDLALLAKQIEEDEDSLPLALEAFTHIEPEIRVAIIGEMANENPSRGVKLLLQGLAEEADRETRTAAAEALDRMALAAAPDREMMPYPVMPGIRSSVIGPIDGEGVGGIAFLLETETGGAVVEFSCDVSGGIVRSELRDNLKPDRARQLFEQTQTNFGAEATRDAHAAALSLVSGSAWFCRESLDDETQESLLAVFGPGFRPHPAFADLGDDSEMVHSEAVTSEDVRLIFDHRPQWIDRSELTDGLALEMALHDGPRPPDPALDPGPFRVLLEGRILTRIELYRRMLLWTALAWSESRPEESHAAKRLEVEMSDPQNAVPGHPFLEELMIRSLSEAKARIDRRASRESKGRGELT